MKRYLYIFLIKLFVLFILTGTAFSQVTGLWVAQKMDERDTGQDASLKMEMKLIDKKGREKKRELFIIRKDFEGEDKLLLEFTYPNDIKGTSFLLWEHKEKDNERFLYLPALGRLRRIATSEKEENFAGTDFSYEDISGRKLDDYTYEIVEEDTIYDGKNCYLLASHPKEKNSKFPKVISWVRKDNFVVLKAEYYNRKDNLEKIYEVLKLEEIDGIWTTTQISMHNNKIEHKTFISVKEVSYNKDIPASSFERRALSK